MKSLMLGMVAVVMLTAGATLAVTPARSTKHVAPKGEEYHHLLMLDVKEAAEHAKTLHHYARTHVEHFDKAVATKHLDELTKNLDGVQSNRTSLEQELGADQGAIRPQLDLIRTDEQTARENLDALKAEMAKATPDIGLIADKSNAIYTVMSSAGEHHHRAMMMRGVKEPVTPIKP